jgi:hypothetical protein
VNRTWPAAEELAELLTLGAEPLPAFAVEDEEAADGDAGWLPPGMMMTATTAAATAAATRAITQVLGRRRICLVCFGPDGPGEGWLGVAWMAGGPQDGAMPVTVGWFWPRPPWVAWRSVILWAMLWSSTWIMRLTSASGLAAPRLSGGRCASVARPGGSSAAVGIRAPSTRTGMTGTPRIRADSISART